MTHMCTEINNKNILATLYRERLIPYFNVNSHKTKNIKSV